MREHRARNAIRQNEVLRRSFQRNNGQMTTTLPEVHTDGECVAGQPQSPTASHKANHVASVDAVRPVVDGCLADD